MRFMRFAVATVLWMACAELGFAQTQREKVGLESFPVDFGELDQEGKFEKRGQFADEKATLYLSEERNSHVKLTDGKQSGWVPRGEVAFIPPKGPPRPTIEAVAENAALPKEKRDPLLNEMVFYREGAFAWVGEEKRAAASVVRFPANARYVDGPWVFVTDTWMRRADLMTIDEAGVQFEKDVKENPDSSDAFTRRAIFWRVKKDYDKSMSDHRKAVELEPDNTMAYYHRGITFVEQGHLPEAIADYDRILELRPDEPMFLIGRAVLRMRTNELPEALSDAQEAVERAPTAIWILETLAEVQGRLGDYRGAVETYDKVIELRPDDPNTISRRGAFHLMGGDSAKAIADFDAAIRIFPAHAASYNSRATARRIAKDYQAAIADCEESLRLDPSQPKTYLNRAMINALLDRHEEAIKDCDKAILLDGNDHNVHLARGESNAKLKKYAEANDDFTRAIRIKADTPYLYFRRADARERLGNRKGAIQDLDTLIRFAPKVATFYVNRGWNHHLEFQYELAASDYEKARLLETESPTATSNLAFLLSTCPDKRYRMPERALRLADEAIKRKATPFAINAKACALAANGEFEKAIELERTITGDKEWMENEELDGGKLAPERIAKWEKKELWLTPAKEERD